MLQSLSIAIPAYNEADRLPGTLRKILDWRTGQGLQFCEILIVDDGSTDGTAQYAETFAADHKDVRVLRNPGNRGKGYAVRNAMLTAAGDWVLYTDADLSTPIEEADKLFAAAAQAGATVAIGSRALHGSVIAVHQSGFREYSGRFFNAMMRTVTGLPFADTQCGFKAYSRDSAQRIFRRQQLDGFSFDVEDLYIARRLGIKCVEVPVKWSNVEGTKVSLRQGLRSFSDLAAIRKFDREGKYD